MLQTRTVLKDQDLYLVGDAHFTVADGESGLYRRDTRFLAHYAWRVDGEPPQVLMQRERAPFWLHQQSANANVGYTMRVGIQRDLTVTGTELRDTLRVTRYRPGEPTRLSLHVTADFVDMFEVRGWPGALPARAVKVSGAAGAVTFTYDAPDGLRSRAVITCTPPAHWDGQALHWDLNMETTDIQVSVHALQEDETPRAGDPDALLTEYAQVQADVLATVPAANPRDRAVIARSAADLRSLTFPTPHGPFPAAGLPWFVAPFGRDSLLIALMTHRHFPDMAVSVARYLAAHQGRAYDPVTLEQPGKILHELRVGELTRLGRTPHRPYYATADATPLFVWLVGELAPHHPGLAQELRPHWEAALAWCLGDGDPDGDGFLEYTPDPGGITNAVWKDSGDSTFTAQGEDISGHVAVTEVQGYAYAAYRAAADLYRQLNEPAHAAQWDGRAERLQAAFVRAFHWPERRYYAHGLNGDKRPLQVLVSNPAHALVTGIYPPEHARDVARTALQDELWSGWGIRTLGVNEPRFNPVSYHNGSVWPHDTALAALGMARYGLHGEAQRVARALFDAAAAASDDRLSELFAGFPRSADLPPVPYPAACHPQGWDAAVPLALAHLLPECSQGALTEPGVAVPDDLVSREAR